VGGIEEKPIEKEFKALLCTPVGVHLTLFHLSREVDRQREESFGGKD
jgi:hypothetical protein